METYKVYSLIALILLTFFFTFFGGYFLFNSLTAPSLGDNEFSKSNTLTSNIVSEGDYPLNVKYVSVALLAMAILVVMLYLRVIYQRKSFQRHFSN